MNSHALDQLAQKVPNGASIAIPPSRSGVALAATRALITHGVRDIHLVAVPTSGIQADMLIGSDCVRVMESAGVTLDEQGQAPRFADAVRNGTIALKDSTCPAIISGVQAGEKGVPFFPMRGLIGTDLLANRVDYKIIDNPMSDTSDPIVLLPAIVPDFALFHAPMADQYGNVWIGTMRELMTLAHAAKQALVTVEQIVEGNLMEDPLRAPATIPSLYITAIAKAEKGAWPLGLEGCYEPDALALGHYAAAARTAPGFADYMTTASRDAAE